MKKARTAFVIAVVVKKWLSSANTNDQKINPPKDDFECFAGL